ncbi:small multidrug resistance pump [Tahibacter aquaticus]|uniref:Small multidrug resistance pump n=1 Tax=Tahibacter aquaticus TaxID=520092 RepID=A0A4R6Z4P5_9GAMM|nr:SMR family transporter [Tahibacter aquaticus]TDR46657.1 small multidrug resistance pump [Tahibacter aquaticus]
MHIWLALAIAIAAEVVATTALKASEGFTRSLPSLVVVLGYGCAFFFLAQALRGIPVGVAYAVWSGAGIVLVSLIAWIFLGQRLDMAAVFGILLILAGVTVIQLFSKASAH